MLASFFVVNGIKAFTKPHEQVDAAEPLATKIVPLAQRVAPPSVANYIPEDTETLVKASGAAQVAGGVMLATGIGRQLGAGVLALSMLPHIAASRAPKGASADERAHARALLLRNIALLGGAMIAAGDTQGRPSLGWRAEQASRKLSREAKSAKKALAKDAKHAKKQITKAVS